MRRLAAPPRKAPGEVTGEGTLLALGGVDFGAEEIEAPGLRITVATPPVRGSEGAGSKSTGSESRGSAQDSFSPLLNSRYEVQLLGDQYAELIGGEPVVLVKAEATKKALVELAPQARYLHIATHGWFAPETFTSMIDSVEGRPDLLATLHRAEDTVRGFAPETLCGLALAGAIFAQYRGRKGAKALPVFNFEIHRLLHDFGSGIAQNRTSAQCSRAKFHATLAPANYLLIREKGCSGFGHFFFIFHSFICKLRTTTGHCSYSSILHI